MIERLTNNPILKKARNVQIEHSLQDVIDSAVAITLTSGKELGVFACGKEAGGKTINMNKGMIKSSSNFDFNSFWFNPSEITSIESIVCSPDEKIISLIHTHPDGNSIPSQKDRESSLNNSLMGCVAGIDEIRCFYGTKDLLVRSI